MPMQVVRDPGPRHIREVHPDIEPVRPHVLLERFLSEKKDIEKFRFFIEREAARVRDVTDRDDHQMPVIIRIPVEDQGVVGGAKDNEVLPVFLVPEQPAKKTALFFSGARTQVRFAPRCPQ